MTAQLSKEAVISRVGEVVGKEDDILEVTRIGNATFHQVEQQKFRVKRKNNSDLIAVFFSNPQDARREAAVHNYLFNISKKNKVANLKAPQVIYADQAMIVRTYFQGNPLDVLTADLEILQGIANLVLAFRDVPVNKLKKYQFDFTKQIVNVKNSLSSAKESFSEFPRSKKVFNHFSSLLKKDWQKRVENLSPGLIHGDLHPKNIVVFEKSFSVVDLSYSSYFYPLFDIASFYIQFIHEYRLEYLDKEDSLNVADLKKKCSGFLSTYCSGDPNFNQSCFDLFKLLIIYRGLEYSTAGFRKKAKSARKHVLFELFKREIAAA